MEACKLVTCKVIVLAKDFYNIFSSYSLSVIPMFVWMGFLSFYAGIGSKLFAFAYKMLGRFPGGLAIVTQAACAVFGAVCGSTRPPRPPAGPSE